MTVPQRIKNRINIWFSNSTSGYIPRRTEIRVLEKHLYFHVSTMFIAALFKRVKMWKPKCPSLDEWMNKMWYIHTMKYSALKRKEILTCYNMDEPRRHHARWNKPVTKIQILCDSIYMRNLKSHNHRVSSRTVVSRGCGEKAKGSYYLMGIEFQYFLKRTIELDGGEEGI